MAFRFLDLPKELRLMVYEAFLPTQHYDRIQIPGSKSTSITLATPLDRLILPPIIHTCHLIHVEVIAILTQQRDRDDLYDNTPRIIMPAGDAIELCKYDGILDEVLNWLEFATSISAAHRDFGTGYILNDMMSRDATFGMAPETLQIFAKAVEGFATEFAKYLLYYGTWYHGTGGRGLEILLEGKGEGRGWNVLLKRLNKRGSEYKMKMNVFWMGKASGFVGKDVRRRRWVSVESAHGGESEKD